MIKAMAAIPKRGFDHDQFSKNQPAPKMTRKTSVPAISGLSTPPV